MRLKPESPSIQKLLLREQKLDVGPSLECLLTGVPIGEKHIKDMNPKAGEMKYSLLAIVTDMKRGRGFWAASRDHVDAASIPIPRRRTT